MYRFGFNSCSPLRARGLTALALSAAIGTTARAPLAMAQTPPLDIVGIGSYAAVGDSHIAMLTVERQIGTDLNGDGLLNDAVLRYRAVAGGPVINTGLAVYNFRIETDGYHVLFLQHEAYVGEDLTGDGDGDRGDVVLGYYGIEHDVVRYTDIQPHINTGSLGKLRSYSISENLISFTQREHAVREDLNGDGDTNDYVVRYFDIDSGATHDTGLVAPYAVVDQGQIATTVSESAAARDVNADGDQDDAVIVVFDTATGATTPVVALPDHATIDPWSYPGLDGQRLVLRMHESTFGEDLDGDGRLSARQLVFTHDLTRAESSYLGFSGGKQIDVKDDFVAYYTAENLIDVDVNGDGDTRWDWLTAVRNWRSGEVHYLPEASEYGVNQTGLMFRQWEHRAGIDANNDGDTSDHFVAFLALAEPQPCPSIGACGSPAPSGDAQAGSGDAMVGMLVAALSQAPLQQSQRTTLDGRLDTLAGIGASSLSEQDKVAAAMPVLNQMVADIDGFVASGLLAPADASPLAAAIAQMLGFLASLSD
ncbi:MAG: hypothetical protein AAF515_15615 [Pseudomonadota bacterium]